MKYSYSDIIGFVFVVVILSFLLKKCINYGIKRCFIKDYSLKKLPKSVKIHIVRDKRESNYKLRYPHWRVPKKDGTRDKRIKNNCIIWENSELHLDKYRVSTHYPYDMVLLVEKLRKHGTHIELSEEEVIIYNGLKRKQEFDTIKDSITGVIEYYEDRPTDFEKLCAMVFEAAGYTARVTPPTNDGGFDILLVNGEGRGIAECKCYALQNIVGRPAIQKLVGANVIAKADKMFFVTTSDFSIAASVYAKETGVKLINGKELLSMLEKYGFVGRRKYLITENDCQLRICDLYQYVPNDIFCLFPQ